MKMNEQFLAQMREAAQLLQTDGPMAASAIVQRALNGAGLGAAQDAARDPSAFFKQAPLSGMQGGMQDGVATDDPFEVLHAAPNWKSLRSKLAERMRSSGAGRQPVEDVNVVDQPTANGKFLSASCTTPAGTRTYKLYVPASYAGEPMPLVVMLHGCKQNPDDFAAGTGMNALADEHGCLIAYPAQAVKANGSNCWNWFNAADQQRNRGEPSIIAAIAHQVMHEYQVDRDRVYVAGLSAGGAMAAILATEYPEIFAAAGVHSGLPVGSAHDVPSAFAAMQNGAPAGSVKPSASKRKAVPIIVFHGDRDKTVNPCNAQQVIAQCTARTDASTHTTAENIKGSEPGGRSYTRTVQRDANGKPVAEHWVLHGSGHAWSGGSRRGSYTDPKGPDASREMLRFFYEHKQVGS